MIVKKGMQKAVDAAVDEIKTNSKKVQGSADIARVATVSAGDDIRGFASAVYYDGVFLCYLNLLSTSELSYLCFLKVKTKLFSNALLPRWR
mgnify:CR=1 FL=1